MITLVNELISLASLTKPPKMQMFINDTHHNFNELEREIIFLEFINNNIVNETLLESLNNLNIECTDKLVIFINKLIYYLKKKGYKIKDINDGNDFATFNYYYKKKQELFMNICNKNKEISFKTKKHFDEENDPMFKGDFLAGINTPLGIACFHFKEEYYDLFKVPEIEHGPKYNNYLSKDVLYRIASIINYNLVINYLNEKELQKKLII